MCVRVCVCARTRVCVCVRVCVLGCVAKILEAETEIGRCLDSKI